MTRPVALISGAGRHAGLGAGIARRLASDGWNLALVQWPLYDDRVHASSSQGDTEALLNELNDDGSKVVVIDADLEDVRSARTIFQRIRQDFGSATALILSHCESVNSGILDTSLESFDRHFAVNTRASWQLIREFALQVPASGGRIVALTSDSTLGNLPYGASKGALDRIVLAAARELAHLHVTANLIHPGPIDTGWMDDETRSNCLARQPGGRLGMPEDIAGVVSFLLSTSGAWINGQLLKVDGGFSA